MRYSTEQGIGRGAKALCADASGLRYRTGRGNWIYVTLREGKLGVEYDGMKQGITKDLIAAGIHPERIVLAFLPALL